MNFWRVSFLCLVAVTTSACQTTSSQLDDEALLTKTEALKVTKDMTWTLRNKANQHWSEYHAADGTLYTGTRKKSYGVGEWWIDDGGRYCINHPNWKWGSERCQKIVEDDAGEVRLFWDNTPGKRGLYATGKVKEGDVYDFADRYSE